MRESMVDWLDRHQRAVLLGPAIVFVVGMIAVPLGFTGYLSLTDSMGSVRRPFSFVGIDNYMSVLSDASRFWPAIFRTFLFTFVALAIEVLLGILIALLLWRPFRGQGWVRVLVLLPMVATPVAVGMMWMLLFEPTIGFINHALSLLGIEGIGWLSSPSTALMSLVLVDAWQWTPMVVLIVMAGLTALPDEPDEAARVDGANALQRLFYVTLPQLSPVIVVAALLRSIDAFKTFDIIYATKGSGGGSNHEVETLNVYAYTLTFDYNEYGVASAVLIVFAVVITLFCVLLMMLLKRRRARL